MRTDELLEEYERFMDKWNAFYKKCIKNPVLQLFPEVRLEEFRQTLGSVGIFLEDTGVELNELHEKVSHIYTEEQQDDIVGQWQEIEWERKMEEGIVKAETMFEEDAHTYEERDY